jgi:hypothetical protein
MEAANGIAMTFGVHGAEKIGGCFVAGFLLPAAPSDRFQIATNRNYSPPPPRYFFFMAALSR